MEEKLRKDYPWLFSKQEMYFEGVKRKFRKVELNPIIEEFDSHYAITREKDASPLILSRNYGS